MAVLAASTVCAMLSFMAVKAAAIAAVVVSAVVCMLAVFSASASFMLSRVVRTPVRSVVILVPISVDMVVRFSWRVVNGAVITGTPSVTVVCISVSAVEMEFFMLSRVVLTPLSSVVISAPIVAADALKSVSIWVNDAVISWAAAVQSAFS